MKDFILKMFDDPNFPIYIGVIIGVLVVAFIVVFFLGKKDKAEFDKTQQLQNVNNENNTQTVPINDENIEQNLAQMPSQEIGTMPAASEVAFKEETPIQKVEVVSPINEPIQPVQEPVQPVSNPQNVVNPEPVVNTVAMQNSSLPVEPVQPVNSLPTDVSEPKTNYDELLNSIDKELQELEQKQAMVSMNSNEVTTAVPNVDTPAIKEEVKPTVINEVFSSVYAPKKENNLDQTANIELPKLKSEESPVLEDKKDDEFHF